jgi:hypothetical protein
LKLEKNTSFLEMQEEPVPGRKIDANAEEREKGKFRELCIL